MNLEHLSPSSLDLIQECPRKLQLSKLEGLSTEGESISTKFGTAWHAIKRLRSLGKGIEEAVAEATKDYIVSDSYEYRTAEKLLKAEQHYTKLYGGALVPLTPEDVELETLLWVEGIPIPIKTITDCIAMLDVNEGTGVEKWVVDYKTTSRLERDWVSHYRVSNQFKAYFAGAKLEHPDLAGVLVDIFNVSKGVSTDRGKAGKSAAEADGCHFYRLPIRYTDFAIEEWKQNMLAGYETLLFHEKRGFYPMHAPTACKAFGTTCPFIDICDTQDPERRELIKLTFTKREDVQESEGP